ncbi:MAG: hypothetical protein EBU90_05455 [Proteobacteria bacterium]|nr:hypothetical protein [Pseudomonadota bacterium]NBP13629.1 hypothetical protein [bacterium]
MSQYIQGVVDYIPMIQPFQPDLNFFQNVLQLKESQYKAGYDKLSSLYGTLLNSPLSREDNIELRNNFFNDISTQIQKISTLDLSKSQNIDAAYKVFQPLIDNDYILKDMSHTKAAYDQIKYGESLRNCTDPKKCPGQYWDGGIKLIQYQMDQFKKADREKTLTMSNPRFVPKVNLTKQALDYAKEMNFKITLPKHSPDGRYIVHTTNGPNMIPGLSETFMSVFGDDPAAADYYSALSELNRNEFINDEANIQKYGSKDAAEMYYLDDMHSKIVEMTQSQLDEAKKQETQASNKKAVTDNIIINKGVDPNDPEDQEVIKTRYQSMVDRMISGSNAEVHETDLNNITGDGYETLDIDSKRYRIDNVASRALMQNDLYQAASAYAMQTMDVKTEVDQYALKQFDHSLSVARMGLEHKYAKDLDDYKTKNQKELFKFQKSLELLKEFYPNKKKNGALPDGSNPANPGYKSLPATPGGSALDPDIKGSDQKQIITATEKAKAAAEQVIVKGYEELTAIINTPIGRKTPGGLVMTQDVKNYYTAKRDELFGKSITTTKTKVSAPEGESFLDLLWNTFTGVFSENTEEYTTTTGGYLNSNNELEQNFTNREEYNNPRSAYYWQNTADRISNFFTNDVTGKYAINRNIEPGEEAGLLAAESEYNTASMNYDNFIKAQAKNNAIVHDLVMNTAAKEVVFDEVSSYEPSLSDPNAGWLSLVAGVDAPDPIKQHTKESLSKMNRDGRIMTLPEFEQIYAYGPEAKKVAEKVMQEYYKTKPGDKGEGFYPFGRYSYDEGVQQILETMAGDAEDIYQQYMDQFNMIYNQSNAAVNKEADKAGFKPLSQFYQVNDSGSGIQANPVVATVDPAYPGDMQAVDFYDFSNFIQSTMGNTEGIEIYKGVGGDLTKKGDADPVENKEGAITAIQALRMQLTEGRDLEDKTRGIFDFYFHPIIENDQNKMAFSISVSPEFTDAHLGGTKAAKFMKNTDREFTIVVDADKVPEVKNLEMVKRLEQGPYTVAMRAANQINLNDFPKGGSLTIKPTADGSYVSSGFLNYIDEETFKESKYPYVSFMGPQQSLENFAQQENRTLAITHMQMVNALEQLKALNPNLIRNPDALNN